MRASERTCCRHRQLATAPAILPALLPPPLQGILRTCTMNRRVSWSPSCTSMKSDSRSPPLMSSPVSSSTCGTVQECRRPGLVLRSWSLWRAAPLKACSAACGAISCSRACEPWGQACAGRQAAGHSRRTLRRRRQQQRQPRAGGQVQSYPATACLHNVQLHAAGMYTVRSPAPPRALRTAHRFRPWTACRGGSPTPRPSCNPAPAGTWCSRGSARWHPCAAAKWRCEHGRGGWGWRLCPGPAVQAL